MASHRTKTIDEIDDLAEMLKVTEAFGISSSGLTTWDELKVAVKEELNPSVDKPSWTAGQTYEILSEAKKSDTKKRERLLELFIKTEKFMDQLGADFTETLQKGLGDFKTTLKKNIDDIKPRDQYVVLVAGETSAGKSSVINLILGEDLLPYALLNTTSTICELKYGEKPKIGVHFKQTGSETREPMFQELVTDGRETYKQQIEKFVYLKSGREKVPYTKIELFFPHPLFKEGIMIVDSPGIGESDVMSEFVLNYLPRAFCFVYVINSYNAGGIQPDRLEKLLTCAQNLKENAEVDLALFTGCTLFVANKWDLVKREEREEVKKAQIEKLSKKLPNLNPKSQIVHLSCKTAQLAQAYGVITGDFDDLIAGISNLVVSSMKNNLEKYCRKLEDLLTHVSRQIRILLKSTEISHQETEERIKRVMSRMEELKSSQERRFGELSEHQSQTIQDIIAKLVAHFKSAETIKKFCDWSGDEVPTASKTWKETKDQALKYVSERTHQFVQQWEDDEHEFAKAQVSLIQYCIDKYDVMADEIYKVEEQAFRDESEADVSQDEEVTQRKSQKSTAPTWLRQGLASVVVSSPRVFSELTAKLKRKMQHKTKLDSFNDNPCSYMSKRSRKCLTVVATEDRLLPFINTQLEDAVQFLKQIKEKIPQLREGDERLYQQLLEDKRSKAEIKEVYEPLKIQIKLLQHSLTVYNLNEIRKSDFTDEELKCDEKWESIIGDGSFSTVYRGVLYRKGQPEIEVALKRYRDPVTTNNVWHFIDEERALRELSHPNIVKFYGTNLQHGRNGTTVIIILELCSCSLSDHVMSHPEEAPARLPKEAVMKKVLGWALNILDALRYIHSKRFVHGDLILDNILLAPDGMVKVADVGVAKHENAVSGAICSTSIYLAPEVFENRIYDTKADMYSFGYVLWELWYGETAFRTAIDSRTEYQVLEDVVKHDLRPTHIEGTQHPWGDWQYVMASCWNKDPKLRLTAQKGWKQLQNFDVSLPPSPPTEPSSLSPSPRLQNFNTSPLPPPPTEPSSLSPPPRLQNFNISPPPPPPTKPSSPSPPPRPPKSSSQRLGPPTKPKPKPKPKKPERTFVSYLSETEDGNVHLYREKDLQTQLREMKQQLARMGERLRDQERLSSEREQLLTIFQKKLMMKDQEVNELEMTLSTTQQKFSEHKRQQATPDWVISRHQIQLTDKLLGKGGWGSVVEGKYCGCSVAVKKIHNVILSPHNRTLFEREMDIASRCRHPCLLQFIGATNDEGSPLFVTELMESSLRALFDQRPLSPTEVSIISLDVARALSYLHQKEPPIIHRDISSGNVLLWQQGNQWRGKVSDYGSANFIQHTMTAAPGAPGYIAPEALTSTQTVKVDVYSFGVLLCEMCIRESPDPNRRDEQIAMVKKRRLRALIRRCVQSDPEKRPNMEEIIQEVDHADK